MGNFRKKISCKLISRGNNSCKEIPGQKNPTMEKYIFHGVMTSLYVRKKNYITRGLVKNFLHKPNLRSPQVGEGKSTHTHLPPQKKSNGRLLKNRQRAIEEKGSFCRMNSYSQMKHSFNRGQRVVSYLNPLTVARPSVKTRKNFSFFPFSN